MKPAMDRADGAFHARRQPVLATVVAVLPNALFRLRVDAGSAPADRHELVGHVAGAMRMAATRLVPGDVVQVELSPFDPTKASITARVGRDGQAASPHPHRQTPNAQTPSATSEVTP